MAKKPNRSGFNLRLSVEVNNEQGSVSAAYFYIRRGKSAEIREFANGMAFADYDSQGRLLGIELLGPCEIAVMDKIAKKEPRPVKRFVHQSFPRGLELVAAAR